MGCTVRMDFEGDQWTFFKPLPRTSSCCSGSTSTRCSPTARCPSRPPSRSPSGRTMIVELDSWYLPDTAATSYRARTRQELGRRRGDRPGGERLRYFHGTGLYELDGEDYRGVFRLGRRFSDDVLPPYTELVRFDAGPRLRGRGAARGRACAAARPPRPPPREQPVRALRRRSSSATCRACSRATPRDYHAYAFATVRMAGSAFEVARLPGAVAAGRRAPTAPRRRCSGSSRAARCSRFKLARRRPFDPEPALAALAAAWDEAMEPLDDAVA